MLELDTNAKFMFGRIYTKDQIRGHIVSRNQLAQILQCINNFSNYASFIEQFWVISMLNSDCLHRLPCICIVSLSILATMGIYES